MQGLGSSGWHAPEQQPGHSAELDPRTDLFGVGATVWSAMTGIDLASPVGQLALQRAAQSLVALPLIRSVTACDPDLEHIVMSLLARSPSARPGSALEVLAQLQGKVPAAQRLPGSPVTVDDAHGIIAGIVDPLVARMFESDHRGVRRLRDGELLCHQDEVSSYAYVLLAGQVQVLRDGLCVATVGREGEIVGEVSAFTGAPRNATLVAQGDVWVRAMNASQLENLVTANPALAVRLIRTMAKRFLQG